MTTFLTLVEQAREMFDEQKYEEATKIYLKSLNHTDDDEERAKIWAELCWCYYKIKLFEEVIESAQKVLEYDKMYAGKPDLYRLMGYSYFALEKDDLAEKFLLKSLEKDDTSEKQKYVYYELGKLYFRNHQYVDAEKYLDKSEQFFKSKAPDYWISMLFFKGFSLFYQDKIEQASLIFKELVDNTHDAVAQSNGFYGQAYIEFEQKNWLNTINICEKITQLNPHFFDMESLGFMMAASFYYLGRYDVFSKYYAQMRKSYKKGRYIDELSKMNEKIPNQPQGPKH